MNLIRTILELMWMEIVIFKKNLILIMTYIDWDAYIKTVNAYNGTLYLL